MARRGENIRKRSDGRWEGRYIKGRSADGKPCWGYVYGATYAEVREISIRKKAEYGIYNLNGTDITFKEISEQWLYSVRQSVKESTFSHYQYTLRHYLLPVFGCFKASTLDEKTLEQGLLEVITPTSGMQKPLGTTMAQECLSMLRRICKYAAHLHLIRPLEISVKLPQKKSKAVRPFTADEQKKLQAYEKIPRKQMFWDVIAIVCMVLSTNKSAIVIYTVILVFRWIVDLHHQTIHKNNLAVLGIICFLCILALCFWLSRSETKGVFLSLYERVYYWTENLSEVSFAELILPYNQFAYGSGAEGGLSFWDNTYLYGLFTQGIVGMILWFNALKECYTLRKKNGDFSAHKQIFELTVALAVLSLTANVTQGRGFLTPYIVLVSTGWTYIKAEN